ncbi:MAG: hypothetical protein PVI00_11115 [Desulfobacterales bacterium]|jgi:hypothetical protein
MWDMIVVLLATIIVFGLFALAFVMKGKSAGNGDPGPACARCDCHRSQSQQNRERSPENLNLKDLDEEYPR